MCLPLPPGGECLVRMLENAARGVPALLRDLHTGSRLRATKWFPPCWLDCVNHSPQVLISIPPKTSKGHVREITHRTLIVMTR